MKILQIHNRYRFPGGEDTVADAERDLLARNGHEVIRFERHNEEIDHYSIIEKTLLFFKPTWSFSAKREVAQNLRRHDVDVVHLHNFFPLVSPAVLSACAAARVPVVYTLHDWRILCANGIFYRDGMPCTSCIERGRLSAIRYGCYRSSRMQTASVVLMQIVHQHLRTWHELVDIFIAPTQFGKDWFVRVGIPADRIIVKPHFLDPDPGGANRCGEYALFVGRLVENKGIFKLLEAWKSIDFPLKIVGSGPLAQEVHHYVEEGPLPNVDLCGQISSEGVLEYMKGASFVIVPSLHYEGFCMVVVEAFACGVPVLASRYPPLTELIDDERNGLLFKPRVSADILSKVRCMLSDQSYLNSMGKQARKDFESKFSAEATYRQLINIYEQAINRTATGLGN